MGNWQTIHGSWVYSDTNSRSLIGDEANANTDGQGGTITATAEAKPKRGNSSSAKASWSATYTGKRTWKADNPNDLPTEETMPAFTVTYMPGWTVAVMAAEGETADAAATAQIILQINGVNKDTQTVIQESLNGFPSNSRPKSQPTQSGTLQFPPFKHSKDMTYGVAISVWASADRTGEGASGNAATSLVCTVSDPV